MAEILIGNVKGPQGETGATGATGPQGVAATVNVGTVSTTAYGNAAQVTNSGTENNAVLNFVIPQGKPGDRTTTMSALTLDTITTSTAEFPSPAVGDTGATAFGKIVKFFADALSAIQAKLDAANVANNLTTTEAGYALDARQGKALNDSLESAVYTGIAGTNILTTGGVLYARRIGRIVNYVWIGNANAVADGTTIGTLDESYRPLADIFFVVRTDSSTYKGSYIAITSTGVVTANCGGGARSRGSVCAIALTEHF